MLGFQHGCWGGEPILENPIQKALAALKRSGTWAIMFLSLRMPLGSTINYRTFVSYLADDRFGFQVLFQSKNSAFPASTRLFEPTEGSKRIVTYCIDQDAARSNSSCHTVCPFRVSRAHVGDKPKLRCHWPFTMCFGFRLVRQYRQDWPEDFLLCDAHVAGHISEYRRLHEIASFQSGRMAFAADDELRTFLDARFDVLPGLRLYCFTLASGPRVTSLFLGSPTLICSTAALARRFTSSTRFSGHDRGAKGRNRQGLTVVQVTGADSHWNGSREVGVVQNDVRRLAPELQRQALHRIEGVLRDEFSDPATSNR